MAGSLPALERVVMAAPPVATNPNDHQMMAGSDESCPPMSDPRHTAVVGRRQSGQGQAASAWFGDLGASDLSSRDLLPVCDTGSGHTGQSVTVSDARSEVEKWTIDGRHYGLTLASTPTSMDLELDDLGPGVGQGLVALVSCDDETQELTVRVFTDRPLPNVLIEMLIADAGERLPGRA
jgi:hypothetical protein